MPEQKTTVRYKAEELADAVGHFGAGWRAFAEVEIEGRLHTGECIAVEFVRMEKIEPAEPAGPASDDE